MGDRQQVLVPLDQLDTLKSGDIVTVVWDKDGRDYTFANSEVIVIKTTDADIPAVICMGNVRVLHRSDWTLRSVTLYPDGRS